MNELNLGVIESRFADIIWQNEPIATQELVRKSEEALQWKRTTTYTVLKRLSDRGLFQNEGGTVTSRISREEFYARRSEKFVEESFDGSLPAFLAAFSARKALTAAEVAEIRRLIDSYEEG
ncbi:MAG: BlaI/MecI/CopY family transcriptional regulator [Clostridia bacterium]|nr:BlaI/MecI/CopY family transcriptional regulator [Clostridia bacterium]